MTAPQFWDDHVAAFMATVGNTPDSSRYYVARHRRGLTALGGHALTLASSLERERIAAQRADAAVVVLAATDGLAASRELYAALLRAGALSTSAVA